MVDLSVMNCMDLELITFEDLPLQQEVTEISSSSLFEAYIHKLFLHFSQQLHIFLSHHLNLAQSAYSQQLKKLLYS